MYLQVFETHTTQQSVNRKKNKPCGSKYTNNII